MGDNRNTQSTMLNIHILLNMRMHNDLAKGLAQINPHWSDDNLYQEARRIMIAVEQKIVYNEWAPLFLGNVH